MQQEALLLELVLHSVSQVQILILPMVRLLTLCRQELLPLVYTVLELFLPLRILLAAFSLVNLGHS